MTAASAIALKVAKNDTAHSCIRRRTGVRLNQQVMQVSRGFWPVKTSLHLSGITGYSVRACEYWLSGERVIPSDALAALMQSEQGRDFLAAVMTDYTPRWWVTLRSFLNRLSKEEQLARAELEYREVLNEQAARPGPHSAFVSDPEFHQGQPAPSRQVVPKKRR